MTARSFILFTWILSALCVTQSFGQVGIGTAEPDSSAELDIYSINKGMLMPRLTTTQIFYIENPSVGLIAFNLDSLDFWFYNGKRWGGMLDQADTLNPSKWICGIDFKYESRSYQTAKIGTQCWMTENLNAGTMINADVTQSDNSVVEKYCYNNSETNCDIYGGLYQWREMMGYTTTNGAQGICPAGWHIATDGEWTTLTNLFGGGNVAGGKLKASGTLEAGTGLWLAPNTGATNESGFTALPGGGRDYGPWFYGISGNGYWWTSSSESTEYFWFRSLHNTTAQIGRSSREYRYGKSVRCVFSIPIVTTSGMTDITPVTATSGGNVTSDGGNPVTARGVCWSTSSNPATSGNHTHDGSGTGAYVSNLTGLAENTLYHVRAYAENSSGTSYGSEVTFTTLTYYPCGDPLEDERDGRIYETVQIGTQCWLGENLRASKYVNGDQIPLISDGYTWYMNYGSAAFCWYNNDSAANEIPYGKLYNWIVVIDSRGLCPTGWHVPSQAEYWTMTTYLGGSSTAGGKLKETGTSHWQSPNSGATNESGFTALPGGRRSWDGDFYDFSYEGDWWTTDADYVYEMADNLNLIYNSASAQYSNDFFNAGFSVRCVADF